VEEKTAQLSVKKMEAKRQRERKKRWKRKTAHCTNIYEK